MMAVVVAEAKMTVRTRRPAIENRSDSADGSSGGGDAVKLKLAPRQHVKVAPSKMAAWAAASWIS